MNPRDRLDALDFGLFGLGLLGIVLFAVLLPRQHPDAAASYALGHERAVEASRSFLEEGGYPTDGLVAAARLSRLPALLDSLQSEVGRPDAIELLVEGEVALPAYYWSVRWHRTDRPLSLGRPEEAGGPPSDRMMYEVGLTQQGDVWEFDNRQGVVPRDGVDRMVLGSIYETDDAMGEMLMAPPDSALAALVYFNFADTSQFADSAARVRADYERLHAAAMTGQPQGLGESAAALIAQQHLEATALGAFPLDVASVEALPERGRSAARVRLTTRERVHGQRANVEADVSAAGALLELRTRFNEEETPGPDATSDGSNIQIGSDSESGVRGIAKVIGYAVIVLLLLGVVFRRIGARALDARAALKDALVAGVFAAAAVGLGAPMFALESGYGWQLLIFLAVGMLFVGAGMGVLVLVASGASDALARGTWPEKIETFTLVRQNAWVNEPMGRVLLRGAAAAGIVLGFVTLAMALFSHSMIQEEGYMGAESSFSLVATAFAQGVWYALIFVLAVYTGLGSMVHKRWPRLVVPALALVLAVIGFDAVNLIEGSAVIAWGVPFVLGLVLALLFVRYDALTLVVAVILVGVLWDTAEGWLVAESPAFVDAMLGWAAFAGVLGLGVVGLRSGRAGEQLPRYVPDYVAEQRERGRLARELEIAREVQRSFLPVRMPRVPGLDLAAACVAAEEVGGDYYDVIALDGRRLALVIGDVSGKGIEAAFFMTLAKGFLQAFARETPSPAEVLRRANRLFFENTPPGTFISVIYGVIDLDTQTFTFARAGHNPVILKRSLAQSADLIQPDGLAIGLTAQSVFDRTIQEDTIPLRDGDTLVFYTDGFSEAMDPAKRLYTDERLAEAVASSAGDMPAARLLQILIDDVVEHAGTARQHDDMTMLVVRIGALPEADVRLDGTSHPDTYIGYA